jgi:outer membrane protein assembly factor BamB
MNIGYRMADSGWKRWRGIILSLLVLSAIRYPPSAIAADRPIRESITLPVDNQTAKTLFTVEEYLAEERYAELTSLLVELVETHGGELVADRSSDEPNVNRYLNVTTYCQRVFAELPPAGRAVARERLDPAAKRRYDAWLATGDARELDRILQSAFISSYGDNALWELGNLAWELGDSSLAAAHWRQLVGKESLFSPQEPRYPDPEFSAADIDARLILCEIFALRTSIARELISGFRRTYPDTAGMLAGHEGPLADILDRVLAESRDWPAPDRNAAMETFGGSAARERVWPVDWDFGPPRWSAEWPIRTVPTFGAVFPGERGPLQSFPVLDEQLVYISDGDAIRAWNAVTGEPAWPNDQPDPSIIYPSIPEERVPLPDRPSVGVPRHTLTLHRGKLLARMGSPVAGAARNELRDLVTELVCLDVERGQGKLVWKLAAHDLPADGPAWSFEGTPLVVDETAYVAVYRRQPEPEFGVAALDADTGRFRWLRSLGSARPNLDDSINRVSQLLLTQGDGRLYLSTDQGAIVAISPDDGALLWAVAYESQTFVIQHGTPLHLQTGLLPPVFHRGQIFAAPNDSRQMFCLDAASGEVVWQKRQPERLRHLIGVTGTPDRGRLIAAGNSLWALDIADGAHIWRIIQSQPSEFGYGHGLIAGESVYWPTREWLYQVRQSDGEIERKILLAAPDDPHSGGNLAAANGLVFIAEPNRLVAYGEYSLLKKRLEVELSTRQDAASLWQQMMNLEAAEGNTTAAVAAGRTAWQLRGTLSPSGRNSLEQSFAVALRSCIQELSTNQEFAAADAYHQELSRLDLPAEQQGRDLWDRSRLDLSRGSPQAAVAHLHDLLAAATDTRFEIDDEPALALARAELARLYESLGSPAFEEVHRLAERELRIALAAGDERKVRSVLMRHPLLESSDKVWLELIERLMTQRRWNAVWPMFAAWESTTANDDREFIKTKMQAALIEAGYDRAAAQMRQEPQSIDDRNDWHFVSRSWQQETPKTFRTICPQGTPPADRLACVLTAGADEIAAWDRQTGSQRWRQSTSDPPAWAAYAATHLLLATRDSLCARSLETGELLWQREWETSGSSPTDAIANPQLIEGRIVHFHPQRGLVCVSAATGEALAEFRPPRGKLQLVWRCDESTILLQTLEPAQTWRLDSSAKTLHPAATGSPSPWRFPPVEFSSNRVAFVNTDRTIELRNRAGQRLWKFAGAISHAHADPYLIADQELLAALIDGGTLVGVDLETGRKTWSAGLADFPITDPERQLAAMGGIVAAAWEKTIRAIRLADGSIAWQAELPAGIADWKVACWSNGFAAMGQSRGAAAQARLLLFDAASGEPRQWIQQPCLAADVAWHLDEYGVVCAMPGRMAAWNAF